MTRMRGRNYRAVAGVLAVAATIPIMGCGDDPGPTAQADEAVTVGPVLELRAADGSWLTRNAQRRESGQELLCIAIEAARPDAYASVCRETGRVLADLVPKPTTVSGADADGSGYLDLVELPGSDPALKRVFAVGLVHGAVEKVVIDDQRRRHTATLGETPLDVDVNARLGDDPAEELKALPPFVALAPFATELPSRKSIKGLGASITEYNPSAKTLTLTTR